MSTRRWGRCLCGGMILAACLTAGVTGAAYPERPIEFTVPFAAGGGSDIMTPPLS